LLTFNSEDKNTLAKNFGTASHDIGIHNFLQSGIEFTIFIKRQDMRNTEDICFDDAFGVGAKYGCFEASDLIVSLILKNYKGFYRGDYAIYHHEQTKNYDATCAYNYGFGFGAFIKKLTSEYKLRGYFLLFIWYVIRNIGAIVVTRRKRYYINGLKGKLKGFMAYPKNIF